MNNEAIFHVIKDPVHGTMQFTATEDLWIKPFINSPQFQRLRHIKQLGMGDFIFPGGVHTRFNHCLGCCYIASQIAHKIGLAEEERQLVMIACLLHDVGHGPFSHAFEDVFHQKLIRHEVWTPFFLAEFQNGSFFEQYNELNPRHRLTEEKFSLIKDMIMHKSSNRVLADIVSSQLDADRLDYLLRDSLFCGITYGHFDLRWMLHSMMIVKSAAGERLGLSYKGIGVVEHYVMARRLMTRNIYHHHKKLAIEFFLVRLLTSLAQDLETEKNFQEIKNSRLGKFLLAANQFNAKIKNSKNVEEIKQQFLKDNFHNYKELCDYDVFAVIRTLANSNEMHSANKIAKRLQYRQMPKIVRFNHLDLANIESLVKEFTHQHRNLFEDWQFALIKSPHQSYSIEEDPILICNESGTVTPLNEISLMINAVSDKNEPTAFLSIDHEIANEKPVLDFLKKITTSPAITA